jgi:hypothetical protein
VLITVAFGTGRLQIRSAPTKTGEIADLNHLATDLNAQSRIYSSATMLQFLLKTIHPGSSWGRRLKEHCANFPMSPEIYLSQGGFPMDWETLALWN